MEKYETILLSIYPLDKSDDIEDMIATSNANGYHCVASFSRPHKITPEQTVTVLLMERKL